MDPELFPVLPEDLSSLSHEELDQILEAAKSTAQAIVGRDEQVLAAIPDDVSVVDAMQQAVATVEAVKSEITRRDEAVAAENAALAELAAQIADPEPEEEQNPEDSQESATEPDAPAEPQAEAAPEAATEPVVELPQGTTVVAEGDTTPLPIAAAGAPAQVTVKTTAVRVTPRSAPPARSREYAPKPNKSNGSATMVAAADTGLPLGAEVTNLDVARAMKKKRESFGRIAEGASEKLTIATITASYPDERTLNGEDDQDKITRAIGGVPGTRQQAQALTASGGLCAPVNPYYDLQTLAQADRPVRDALVGFNATRGGIRYAPPASLSSITTGGGTGAAIGRITASQDASNTAKTCQHISCPTFQEVDVAAIYHCLTFGNLGARAWPEQVANFTQLAMAAWARTAETALLDGIEAASIKTTGAQAAGANSTLVGQVLEASAAMRNRHRMDPDANLRLMMPAWGIDLLLADSMRTAFPRYPEDDAGLKAMFAKFNVTVTFFWDASSTSSNVFGGQTTGIALNGFPPTIDWYLYPEGSFLFVDSGSLELGIVRDSTLNSTNDYQVFGESWENVAFIGVESLRVRSTVCDTGGTGAATSISCGSA